MYSAVDTPIANIYLTVGEVAAVLTLPGSDMTRKRLSGSRPGQPWSFRPVWRRMAARDKEVYVGGAARSSSRPGVRVSRGGL